MKVFVTGVNGQLGHDVMNELAKRGHEGIGSDLSEVANEKSYPYISLDITNKTQVHDVIKEINPDCVVHCAAWTAVDLAEDEEEKCRLVNKNGTENIVDACRSLDIPIMYFSTDYVFDGEGTKPWNEYDERNPLNVYGLTKYEGELAVESYEKHFIVRIAWVFGVNGNNFIKTMLRLGRERGAVSVVYDQIGSPTYTYDLAKLVVDMILTDKYGTYHVTNQGFCSWYEFACEIFKQAAMDVKVTPVNSDQFPVKAKRPHNSRMDEDELDKAGFVRLPSWQDALRRYLKIIQE